jgi:hypothetical protein
MVARLSRFSGLLLWALIFAAVWTLHAPWLRLPYFWDESGYFVPAAHDLLRNGDWIPTSTLSNAHPPLVMAWLAAWWKLLAFTPLVTRTAMLTISAFALMGVFRLARRVSNLEVAVGSTILTAFYPVFFAQSSLAHLDMAAAALSLWGLEAYVSARRWQAAAWFGVAALAKETALLAPAALFSWELLGLLPAPHLALSTAGPHKGPAGEGARATKTQLGLAGKGLWLALTALPLVLWLAYHRHRTGFVFGNPEYFRYNVGATAVRPLRIALALAQRVWQLFGYLNMFVLTGAAVAAMCLLSPDVHREPRGPQRARFWLAGAGGPRPRIALEAQFAFAAVGVGYLAALSLVGGAVLARYLLPVYPLVILECVATLWRRLSWWKPAAAAIALAFVAGLLVDPPYRIAPEDTLAYVDYVRLHQAAASALARLDRGPQQARCWLAGAKAPCVLTAWPASDELRRPYLGYVNQPIRVVPVENFGAGELMRANRDLRGQFDYVWIFSEKYEPPYRMWGWWEEMLVRYFDYRRDLQPQAAAALLGGEIVYEAERRRQWVAIVKITD